MVRSCVLLGGMVLLCACGYERYRDDPNTVIARPYDTSGHGAGLPEGGFAIVYDGDGCQNWIKDDGVEGYSSPRVNPETGKPICDSKYPPGTVLGRYRAKGSTLPDFVPKPRRIK